MNSPDVSKALTTAAVAMLSEQYPGLTPAKLESALAFKPEAEKTDTLVPRTATPALIPVSLPTIDRMLACGELTRVKVRGRIFIRKSEIDRLISGEKREVVK